MTDNKESNLNIEINNIMNEVLKNLPEGATLEMSPECIDDIKKYLNVPQENYNDIIKKVCCENIIDQTINMDNTVGDIIKMRLTVNKANYGNYLYWKIICDIPCKNSLHPHPLRMICQNDDFSKTTEFAEVVSDNDLMRKMFEYLCKSDDELNQLIGSDVCVEYRARIIKAITFFWD